MPITLSDDLTTFDHEVEKDILDASFEHPSIYEELEEDWF